MENKRIISIMFFSVIFMMTRETYGQFPNAYVTKYPSSVARQWKPNVIARNKIWRVQEYTIKEGMADSTLIEKRVFDKKGNEIENIFYDFEVETRIFASDWRNDLLKEAYEINSRNRKDSLNKSMFVYSFPKIIMYNQTKGERVTKRISYYNEKDSTLAKEERYDDLDDSTRLTYATIYRYSPDSITNDFYESGVLLLREIQEPLDDLNVISYSVNKDGNCDLFFKRRFNEDGNLVSEVLDVKGEYSVTKYFYDNNGLLKVKMVTDDKGKETYIYKYTYW
jgi:hypothetical protein